MATTLADDEPPPSARKRSGSQFGPLQLQQAGLLLAVLACIPASTYGQELGGKPSANAPVWEKFLKYLAVIALVCATGISAGLTLGLMGLDKIGLEIVKGGDDPKSARYANRIIPVREKGNLLLCTLLLTNVALNALISILLASLTSGLVGFFISTLVITIFGEMIPQAVCSRHALRIGSFSVPVVKGLMLLLWPLCKPCAVALDWALGEEIGTIHSRTELRQLLHIHVKHGAIDIETGREVQGALQYKDLQVKSVMTPRDKVFMLSADARLGFKTISDIFKSGFSRIPVYGSSLDDIIGVLITKDLIFIDPEDETPVRNFVQIFGRSLQVVWPDQSLGDTLKLFKQGKGHMAIVRDVNNTGPSDPYYEVAGIITLEDIIEEILGEDIIDETDAFDHVAQESTRLGPAATAELRQNFDMTRLKLLNANAQEDKFSKEEASAVAAHLAANTEQFKGMSLEAVLSVVLSSSVLNLKRLTPVGASVPLAEDILYRRGKPATECTLVMTGRVAVLAGKDQFVADAGPWTVLAADALMLPLGSYKPDFSAHIGSDAVRIARISKSAFRQAGDLSSHSPVVPASPTLTNSTSGPERSSSAESVDPASFLLTPHNEHSTAAVALAALTESEIELHNLSGVGPAAAGVVNHEPVFAPSPGETEGLLSHASGHKPAAIIGKSAVLAESSDVTAETPKGSSSNGAAQQHSLV